MQLAIAYLIGNWWWWFVVAFFIISICLIMAALSPIAALIAWLIVSPFGKPFLYLEFGWRAIPAITFDFVAIYTLAILAIFRTLANRPKLRKLVAGEWFMLGFVAYVAAMQFGSADAYTIGGFLRALSRKVVPNVLIISVLYFVTKAAIQKKAHVTKILGGMVVLGILMGIANIYEHYTGNRWYSPIVGFGVPLRIWTDVGKGRAAGVFEHVAAPAALIATTFYLAYYLAGWCSRPVLKLVLYTGMAIISIGAFFTYTRNVYIVFALVTLTMPFLVIRTRVRATALAVLFVTAALLVITPIVLSNKQLYSRFTADTLTDRFVYASTAVNVIKHHFWFGVGLGNLNEVQINYVTNMKHINRRPGGLGWANISHNTYLTIMAEEGVFGFVLYFGGVAAFLVRLVRMRRRFPSDDLLGKDLISVFLISSIGFLISIFAASVYLVPYVTYIFWIQFAIAIKLEELWERERSAEPILINQVSKLEAVK